MPRSKKLFTPVEQIPRYKLVAQQIAELINSGQLPVESKMPTDRELVEQLGVSRATVREAMIALEIAGFVENRFGAGAFVSAIPPQAGALSQFTGPGPFELLEARMVIEGEIAYMASQLITPEQIAHLEHCNIEMRKESDSVVAGSIADREFHNQIVKATKNTSLINIVSEFWRDRKRLPMWVQMHHRLGEDEEIRDQLIAEHTAVVSALHARDAQLAKDTMREHIANFGRSLLERWHGLEDEQKDDVAPPSERLVQQLL